MHHRGRNDNRDRRLRTAFAATALATGIVVGVPATSGGAVDQPTQQGIGHRSDGLTPGQVATIRHATYRFRDVDAAMEAGYEPMGECMDMPGEGAVGHVYMNHALMEDGVLDPKQPEILLYEARHHGSDLRLTGVGFHAVDEDQDVSTDDDRPSLLGHPLAGPMASHEPGMPIHYFLHAWVFKHNPSGNLAAENPRVDCD